MLISLSAIEYKWYTYKGKKNITLFREGKVKDWELSVDEGEVFGVRQLEKDGVITYAVKHEEAQNLLFYIDQDQYKHLMKNSKAHVGKIDKPTAAVENPDAKVEDKNNEDSYENFVYTHPKRGTTVYNSIGTKIGVMRKGDTFGLFSENPIKGGWLWVKESKDINVNKPIKIKADIFSILEVNSKKADYADDEIEEVKPVRTKPATKPAPKVDDIEEVKPVRTKPVEVPAPTGQVSAIPSVADLKPLNEKVNAVVSACKAVGKQAIRTFEDFERARDTLNSLLDNEVSEIKGYMESIGMPKDMKNMLIKTLKSNYDQTVEILRAKKKSLSKPVETKTPTVGPITLGETKVDFAKMSDSAKRDLKNKYGDIVAVENEEELNLVIDSVKEIYKDYEAKLKAQGRKEGLPAVEISKTINVIKEKYLEYLEKLNDQKTSYIKAKQEGKKEDVNLDGDDEDDMEPDVSDIDDLDDYSEVTPQTKPTDIAKKLADAFKRINEYNIEECEMYLGDNTPKMTPDTVDEVIDDLVTMRTDYIKSIAPYSSLPNYSDRKAVLAKFDAALLVLENAKEKWETLDEHEEEIDDLSDIEPPKTGESITLDNLKELGSEIEETLEEYSKKARTAKSVQEIDVLAQRLQKIKAQYSSDAAKFKKLPEYKVEVDEMEEWFNMYEDELAKLKSKIKPKVEETKAKPAPTKPAPKVEEVDEEGDRPSTDEEMDDFMDGFEDTDSDFKPEPQSDLVSDEEDDDPFDSYGDINDIFGGGKIGARPGDEDED